MLGGLLTNPKFPAVDAPNPADNAMLTSHYEFESANRNRDEDSWQAQRKAMHGYTLPEWLAVGKYASDDSRRGAPRGFGTDSQ